MPRTMSSKKAGLPPGTPLYIGEQPSGPVRITLLEYDEKDVSEKELQGADELAAFKDTPKVSWINIEGVHQIDIIEKIGAHFALHPLVLEDITNTEQRPKVEDYSDHVYIVLKMLSVDEKNSRVKDEQVSLVLGKNFVLSFQQRPGDVFGPVRERIRTGKGKIRKYGADFLVYSLMDAVVDNYFGVLERFSDDVERIEDRVVRSPDARSIGEVYRVKRETLSLRKSLWPLRGMINELERTDSKFVSRITVVYFRDMYDHSVQLIDTVETLRERLSELIDIYLSSQSNRLNEIMKVLTIITTLFIPLTFITGLYGMNFHNMPELSYRYAYPIVLGVMAVIVAGMLVFFRRRKWI